MTENVAYLQTWVINVHGWDTATNQVGTMLGQSVLWSLSLVPLPWRVCARVQGDRVDVKAWALSGPEPAWSNPLHTLSVPLPPEFAGPGQAGWYAGHLTSGDEVRFRDTVVWGRSRDSWPTNRLRSLS